MLREARADRAHRALSAPEDRLVAAKPLQGPTAATANVLQPAVFVGGAAATRSAGPARKGGTGAAKASPSDGGTETGGGGGAAATRG